MYYYIITAAMSGGTFDQSAVYEWQYDRNEITFNNWDWIYIHIYMYLEKKNYNNNNLDLKLVRMISENLTQSKQKKIFSLFASEIEIRIIVMALKLNVF